MNTFPIKFKVSNAFIEELKACEYGRYEDAMWAREQKDQKLIDTNNYQCVFNDFADRFKTQIEVRNILELKELEYALRTGTISIHMPKATQNLRLIVSNYLREIEK